MSDTNQPVIGPYESRPAACRDYDLRAAMVARIVADSIASCLPGIRVEHVGSTAVPGCAGRGIVDLLIAATDREMEAVKSAIDGLGFQHQTASDVLPEERPMRVGSMVHDGETFLLHVHVIPAGLPEVEDMRFFRTCLRADPELLKAYVARKRKILADSQNDALSYSQEKGKFIKEVLG